MFEGPPTTNPANCSLGGDWGDRGDLILMRAHARAHAGTRAGESATGLESPPGPPASVPLGRVISHKSAESFNTGNGGTWMEVPPGPPEESRQQVGKVRDQSTQSSGRRHGQATPRGRHGSQVNPGGETRSWGILGPAMGILGGAS